MKRRAWLIAAALVLPTSYCTADLYLLDRGIGVAAGPDGESYRIRPGSWVTKVTGADATTIGRTIHLKFEQRPTTYLLAHEWRHVSVGVFIPRYLVDPGYKARKESDAHRWGCEHRFHPHFLHIERALRQVSLTRLQREAPDPPTAVTCEGIEPLERAA